MEKEPIPFEINKEEQSNPRPFQEVNLDSFALNVLKRNVLKPITISVYGDDAATAVNYGCFFIADRGYAVVGISESHNVIGIDAGSVTLSVEKCGSGVAPGSGSDLLATAFSLKATARTPQFGTLTKTLSSLALKRGDRLILKDTGVLTAVSDVCVTVLLLET